MNPTGAGEKTLDWRIETVDETSSTNDLVSARAREGEPGGLVIRAIAQTRGRGRRGRSWFSPPGADSISPPCFARAAKPESHPT